MQDRRDDQATFSDAVVGQIRYLRIPIGHGRAGILGKSRFGLALVLRVWATFGISVLTFGAPSDSA